jgi:hypothetical protein
LRPFGFICTKRQRVAARGSGPWSFCVCIITININISSPSPSDFLSDLVQWEPDLEPWSRIFSQMAQQKQLKS